MGLFAEVTFSNESLALISVVLGSVVSAAVWLWRIDIARIQDQVSDLRTQRDRMFQIIVRNGLGDELRPDARPPDEPKPPGCFRPDP